MAKAQKQTMAIQKWEQEMEEAATKQAAAEKPTGNKSISTRGGKLSIDGNDVEDSELEVIVLAAVHANLYYEGRYDPENPTTPVCYAFGEGDEPEGPHDDSTDKQSDTCAECEKNQWGSADQGRGKACKNTRKLAVMLKDDLDDIEKAEVRTMSIPPTQLRGWSSYVRNKLLDLKRPTWGVVTKISCRPDPKTQINISFNFVELVQFDDGMYEQMKKKAAQVVETLVQPFPKQDEKTPLPQAKKGKRKF